MLELVRNLIAPIALAAISAHSVFAQNDEFVRISVHSPIDFNVMRQLLGTEEHIFFDFSEGLITFDEKGKLIGGLADRWTVENGGLHYVFHIRDEAKWSNGDPITSHDFVRSVRERLIQNKEGSVPTFDLIGNIEGVGEYLSGETDVLNNIGIHALDDQHLSIRFANVSLYQLNDLSTDALLPVHEDWKQYPPDGSKGFMPSSGAYYPIEFVPDQKVILQKNPHYYGASAVEIDTVKHLSYQGDNQLLSEKEAIYRALLEGEIHLATEANSDVIEWFGRNQPEFLLSTDYRSFNYIEFNFQNPALADHELRKALALALDYETIAKISGSIQLANVDRWFVGNSDNLPPSRISIDSRPYEERIEEAKAIMSAKGYNAKAPLKLVFRTKSEEISVSYAQALIGMWQQIGVEIEHAKHDDTYKYYTEYLIPGDFDISLPAWNGITPDYGYFINFAHSDEAISGSMNFGNFKNLEFDETISRANLASTIEKRNDLLVDAEKILVEDFGKLPISRNVNFFLVSSEIETLGEGRFGHYLSRHANFKVNDGDQDTNSD